LRTIYTVGALRVIGGWTTRLVLGLLDEVTASDARTALSGEVGGGILRWRQVIMRTAGIDLATQDKNTAICVVDWSESGVCVDFCDDVSDVGLIRVCQDADVEKVGIDCPFGWPAPFVAAISAHALGQDWPGRGHPDPVAFMDMLAFRLTDLRVKAKPLGAHPLAVAADRIGKTAMRCARLLDALGPVDRSGRGGTVAEVYPAASLLAWDLPNDGLKGAKGLSKLNAVLARVEALMPALEFRAGGRDRCVMSDHAFDALICALTARAVATSRTALPVTDEEISRAAIEGWIHVPTVGPDELVRPCSVGREAL
jgi:predicted nuclease with RNAse H fold